MIRSGILEGAQAKRRHLVLANGTGYWRSDLVATPPAATGSSARASWTPQAFLVEQDANKAILPHFHEQDEFQVIVEGDGTFGRHAVEPVTVHYAGRHTGYGPIHAGPRGLWYLSLRARTDAGARFLPEARAQMEKGPKRQLLGDPVAVCSDADLRDPAPATIANALDPQSDGIAAWMVRVPPRAAAQPPTHPAVAARFFIVIAGEMLWQGERLPRLGTVFADSPEFAPAAGDAGLQLLCVQFPC